VFFTIVSKTQLRQGEKSMNEDVTVVWTDEIIQIEELEQKIAPNAAWDD
jgi:hypothetical protein